MIVAVLQNTAQMSLGLFFLGEYANIIRGDERDDHPSCSGRHGRCWALPTRHWFKVVWFMPGKSARGAVRVPVGAR